MGWLVLLIPLLLGWLILIAANARRMRIIKRQWDHALYDYQEYKNPERYHNSG